MITNSAHIPAYRNFGDDFCISAVSDINETAARETAKRHGIPNWYKDAEEMLEKEKPELDDFGTVPISEGYEVTPWYNSSNGSFYGYDGMSENFCRVINAYEPYVDPMEILCSRWRNMLVNYRGDVHYLPDWLKKKPKIMEFMSSSTDQWSKRWDEQQFPYDDLKPLQEKYNIQTCIDGDAHFACDYRIGFKLGFGGFLEKIEKYRKINPDKKGFYDAEEKCVRAIIAFIDRHIAKIREMIPHENRAEIKASLEEMLKTCENVRLDAPKTFREVCQWTARVLPLSRTPLGQCRQG